MCNFFSGTIYATFADARARGVSPVLSRPARCDLSRNYFKSDNTRSRGGGNCAASNVKSLDVQARIAEKSRNNAALPNPQFFLSATLAITLAESIFAVRPTLFPLYTAVLAHGCLAELRKGKGRMRGRGRKNEFGEFEESRANDPTNNRVPMRRRPVQLHTQSATPTFASHRRSFQSQRVESFAPTSKGRIKSPGGGYSVGGETIGKKNRRSRAGRAEGVTFETFPVQLASRVRASSPSFFNPCNKIAERIKDAEVDRSCSESRQRFDTNGDEIRNFLSN